MSDKGRGEGREGDNQLKHPEWQRIDLVTLQVGGEAQLAVELLGFVEAVDPLGMAAEEVAAAGEEVEGLCFLRRDLGILVLREDVENGEEAK
ncbi:hypothetical protein CDL15_Pgr020983 [Punica granatum]|uniref:Uncharacterized protein n=1 Tax=Punica granatum TaxID=22663 RepID=A0A218Y0S1_PUNGR|nr:hypothetical protein CDL15_Pgr020983 [Punica granatum]